MYKIKAKQFPHDTHAHRMAGYPDTYQLEHGRNMLYFNFDCKMEYEMALERTGGKRVMVQFRERYHPFKHHQLIHPEPSVTETNMQYAYVQEEGFELVTVQNAGTLIQQILNNSNGIIKKSDWFTACGFMDAISKHLSKATVVHDIYCNPSRMGWELVELDQCQNDAGLYLGILVERK